MKKTIELDDRFEEMLIWAERYAIGRMTYASDDTALYILELVPHLSSNTLICMIADIEGERAIPARWSVTRDKIINELERRNQNATI